MAERPTCGTCVHFEKVKDSGLRGKCYREPPVPVGYGWGRPPVDSDEKACSSHVQKINVSMNIDGSIISIGVKPDTYNYMDVGRSLVKVIDRIIEVIPSDEYAETKAAIIDIRSSAEFASPETGNLFWEQLTSTLEEDLGDPTGCAWKEKVQRIFNGEE